MSRSSSSRSAAGAGLRKKKKGGMQAEMAEKVGIDRSFLADVEPGKRKISIYNLALIAEGLEVTLSRRFSCL